MVGGGRIILGLYYLFIKIIRRCRFVLKEEDKFNNRGYSDFIKLIYYQRGLKNKIINNKTLIKKTKTI